MPISKQYGLEYIAGLKQNIANEEGQQVALLRLAVLDKNFPNSPAHIRLFAKYKKRMSFLEGALDEFRDLWRDEFGTDALEELEQ
jgi:hypothetical protein